VVEKAGDFLGAEHDGEFMGAARARKAFLAPGHLQGDQVEKLDGGDEGVDAFGGELFLVEQIQFVLPHGFEIGPGRGGVIELGEAGDIVPVTSLGSGGEATQFHVLDKTLL
jgi:hypothetical protein